jgi:hypothetical protein
LCVKTYSITMALKEGEHPLPGFEHVNRSFALGAMAMAEAYYAKRHLICTCDQTGDVLEEVFPREIHLN